MRLECTTPCQAMHLFTRSRRIHLQTFQESQACPKTKASSPRPFSKLTRSLTLDMTASSTSTRPLTRKSQKSSPAQTSRALMMVR